MSAIGKIVKKSTNFAQSACKSLKKAYIRCIIMMHKKVFYMYFELLNQ